MSAWRRGPVVGGCWRGDRRGNRRSVRGYAGRTKLVLAALVGALALAGIGAWWWASSAQAIVGGTEVPISGFPFQVALYDPHAGSVGAGFFCGGVIVDATHVATAAHCAIDEGTGRVEPPSAIAVLAGTARLGEAGQPLPAGAIEDPASATSLDPRYEPASNDYDVAVIRLAHPLWQGRAPAPDGRTNVAPIAVSASLATAYTDALGARAPIVATVSGWGDLRAETPGSQGLNGAYPTALQAAQIPLVSPLACADAFGGPGSLSSSQLITARMLCAGVAGGGRDSCFGDSGGPLVVDRSTPAAPPADYVLAGLVSFGEGCAQPESPGVYASIADPEIAAFITSNPPQTPLTQSGLGRARYVHACTRSRQQLCRPGATGHHHHHHRPRHPHPRHPHPRHPHRPRPAKRG